MSSYPENTIPLGLVVEKNVELYEFSAGGHAVPLFMLGPGEFFGLFQNFCKNFVQPNLQGSAGGTTIVLLPRVGGSEALKDYARAIGIKREWSEYEDDLKSTDKSRFFFGRFLSDLLLQTKSNWRTQIALFQLKDVDRIRTNRQAHETILALTLEQMRFSYERGEQVVEILSDRTLGNADIHVLALRMIFRGLRPGFAPVFGSVEDNNVLPANDLNDLFYAKENPLPNATEFYPAILRPSFRKEPALYLLNWPYMEEGRIDKRSVSDKADRAAGKAQEFEIGRGLTKSFQRLSEPEILNALRKMRGQATTAPEKPIIMNKWNENYFLKGGVIAIFPRDKK
jgi:hypothetical protein